MHTTTKKCYGWWTCEWALTFNPTLFLHLLLRAPLALLLLISLMHQSGVSPGVGGLDLTNALKLMESLLAGRYSFHCCERWLHCHHNGSVNSKHTHTPKSICQVLKYLGLERANKIGKLNRDVFVQHFVVLNSLYRL